MKAAYLALLIGCCVFFGGCVVQSRQTAQVRPSQNEVLEPGDTIFIVFNGPGDHFPPDPYEIDEHRLVTLPLIGSIEIGGLTTKQAATKIHDAYVPKYFPELTFVVRKVELRKSNRDDQEI